MASESSGLTSKGEVKASETTWALTQLYTLTLKGLKK